MDFKIRPFFLLVFLFLTQALHSAGFVLDTSGGEPRFIQTLEWRQDEYVLFYDILIQRRTRGQYIDFLQQQSDVNSIDLSLPSGSYRYHVIPYDLLGRAGEISEWRYFEVRTAYQPQILNFLPKGFYFERENVSGVLDILGVRLFPESEIFLQNNDFIFYPLEVEVWGENRARLFFDVDYMLFDKEFKRGDFEIHIVNPGGLETSAGDLYIGYRKPVDFILMTAWMPAVPLSGQAKDFFGSKFFPAGLLHSFGVVASKRAPFNFGIEFSAAAYLLNNALYVKGGFEDLVNRFYTSGGSGAVFAQLDANFLLQKWIEYRVMAVRARVGGGVSYCMGFGLYEEDDSFFHFNIGLSYLQRLNEVFYIEPGIDFTFQTTENVSVVFKPRLGVGWQF
jgi:hypothetical protein